MNEVTYLELLNRGIKSTLKIDTSIKHARDFNYDEKRVGPPYAPKGAETEPPRELNIVFDSEKKTAKINGVTLEGLNLELLMQFLNECYYE